MLLFRVFGLRVGVVFCLSCFEKGCGKGGGGLIAFACFCYCVCVVDGLLLGMCLLLGWLCCVVVVVASCLLFGGGC